MNGQIVKVRPSSVLEEESGMAVDLSLHEESRHRLLGFTGVIELRTVVPVYSHENSIATRT